MGLMSALARCAARHPHVLVVEAAGNWQLRAALERRVLARGGRLADSPADADVLAVCGAPGPQLAEAIDAVWEQIPGPRIRLDLAATDVDDQHLDAELDAAITDLADTERQRDDAADRCRTPDIARIEMNMHDGDMDGGDMDMGDMEMDMSPSGIALAEGGQDRDGLEMDVLHLRLGPVLRYWPVGIVVCCALQGDLVVDAEAWRVDPDQSVEADDTGGRVAAARECDRLVSLLSLAGWPRAATRARRVRDLLLASAEPAPGALAGLSRMVSGSRIFRWSMNGVTDGYVDALDRARALLTDPESTCDTAKTAIDEIPQAIIGLELAAARLVIAGLDLSTAPARQESRADDA